MHEHVTCTTTPQTLMDSRCPLCVRSGCVQTALGALTCAGPLHKPAGSHASVGSLRPGAHPT
eukprot:scaffold49111_cov18-Tisochrysis_lutea.AAC.1